jgi:hypothetical protein
MTGDTLGVEEWTNRIIGLGTATYQLGFDAGSAIDHHTLGSGKSSPSNRHFHTLPRLRPRRVERRNTWVLGKSGTDKCQC